MKQKGMYLLTCVAMAAAIIVIGSSISATAVLQKASRVAARTQDLPEPQIIVPHSASNAGSLCTLQNNGDTILSFYHGIVTGDRFATYINPRRCAGSPQFPFAVQSVQLGLYTDYGGVWPVQIAIEVWLPADADSCSGPATLVCADTVMLDEASFLLPNLGTITLNHICCMTRPFFIAVCYTGATPTPFPSVTFDSRMPGDSCLNWGYVDGFGWNRWSQYWAPPQPGNLVIWVEGEMNSGVCGSTACCAGTTGNVDCDPNDNTDISDLSALIDNLYISFTPLCCSAEANIDGQSGTDISDLSALIDYLYITFTPTAACQ